MDVINILILVIFIILVCLIIISERIPQITRSKKHDSTTGGNENYNIDTTDTDGDTECKSCMSGNLDHILSKTTVYGGDDDEDDYKNEPSKDTHESIPILRPELLSWQSFDKWSDLKNDRDEYSKFLQCRTTVLNGCNLDWGPAYIGITSLLDDDMEYIGIANIDNDGKTVYIKRMDKADKYGHVGSHEISGKLLEEYSNIVGAFIFHTHKLDKSYSWYPSSSDLIASVHYAYQKRFIASVVFSGYGTIVYSPELYAINEIYSHDKASQLLHLYIYMFNIATTMESQSSWSPHSHMVIMDSIRKLQMVILIYPTSYYISLIRSINPRIGSHSKIDFSQIDVIRKLIKQEHKKLENNGGKK